MNWKSYVHIERGDEWAANSCVYATKAEAEAAGNELLSRWYVPDRHEARETADPVNYRFNFETGKGERIAP